ncbi:MAG: hypothetical protein ACP5OZ_02305 [Candidatus Woesearchaeota archaeon]
MKEHNIKILKLLFLLMGVFSLMFLIALYDQNKGAKIFDIGFEFENYLVMIFSIGSLFRIVYEIYRIENH